MKRLIFALVDLIAAAVSGMRLDAQEVLKVQDSGVIETA